MATTTTVEVAGKTYTHREYQQGTLLAFLGGAGLVTFLWLAWVGLRALIAFQNAGP